MKKFITFILLAIILFIGLFQLTLLKHKKLIEEVCSYQSAGLINSTKESSKKFFYKCFTVEALKRLYQGKKYCQSVAKPNCTIQADDTLLCQGMLRQKRWTKSQQDCELNFACPELVEDYDKIQASCNN